MANQGERGEQDVAVVVTAIPGAGARWERDPACMRADLDVAEDTVRHLLARWDGYEARSDPERFRLVFPDSASAVGFCLACQEALELADWPRRGPAPRQVHEGAAPRGLPVAMGVHAGRAEPRRDPTTGRTDWVGPVPNRAGRLADAAAGGQILASEAAWTAASLDVVCLAEDLGPHALRGLGAPERVWSLLPRALAGRRFPPLDQDVRRRGGLPEESGSFVGRRSELGRLEWLAQAGHRLVTLAGPAGAGKTRLAVRFGASCNAAIVTGGAWFVRLAGARNAGDLVAATSAALAIPLPPGEPDAGVEQIARALAARPPLMCILDGADEVVEPLARAADRWRAAAPGSLLLVTSQARLGLPGEAVVEVGPLPLPDALALFIDRARAVVSDFAAPDSSLRRAVERVDGLPLGIELAAAQLDVSSITQLARARQSTDADPLSQAVEAAWRRLKPEERRAMAQLSAFAGGFWPRDAGAVLALDGLPALDALSRLRARSMLCALGGGRLGMYRAVAAVAAAALDASGERAAVEERHAERILGQAQEAPATWLAVEEANLLAVRDRFRGTSTSVRAALALHRLYRMRGPARSSLEVLEVAIHDAADRALRADAHLSRAETRRQLGWHAKADEDLGEALSLAVSLHDFGREGAVLAERGRMLRELGHLDAAVACFERGLPMLQSSHRTAAEALAITGLANVRWEQGRFDEAETLHGTALAMFRAIGDRAGEGRATCDLAAVLHGRGHFAAAAARFHDALAVHREVGDRRMEGNILCNLGACLIEIGGHAEARAHLEASRVLCAETGDRRGEGVAMYNLGDACIEADEPEVAELWLARAMAVARELDNARGLAFAQANLGRVRWMRGDLRAAAARLHEAAQAFVTLGVPWAIGLVRSWEGAALADAGEEEAALAALARAADGRPTGDTAIMLRLSRAHVDALRARRGGPSARSAALGALREVRQDVPAPSANVRFSLRMLERSLGGLAT